ncbi:MAG: hypothetical protein HYV09_02260 [Deltaproteobacteria bacterium]|nr:hypothetical protein [Deltaproteobacteria bacterium]
MTAPDKSSALVAALIAGAVFGVVLGGVVLIASGDVGRAIVVAIGTGAVFGGLLAFVRRLNSSGALDDAEAASVLDEGEQLLHVGVANHFKGIESVGGRLYLTTQRLRFRSHRVNIRVHDEWYPLESVVRVEAARTLGIIPNGLRVHLAGGAVERFVVEGNAAWAERIERARQSAPAAVQG